ncbi:unnamed protein product [Vicia faba]|uniref:Uncharacterized protein n=1 Tax=Vicia faba TaxID=3906 RepID=A0AAV1AHY7_VICFA|nr:unnamed protein product [Vicia faba]
MVYSNCLRCGCYCTFVEDDVLVALTREEEADVVIGARCRADRWNVLKNIEKNAELEDSASESFGEWLSSKWPVGFVLKQCEDYGEEVRLNCGISWKTYED